jgi:hypothetical protein
MRQLLNNRPFMLHTRLVLIKHSRHFPWTGPSYLRIEEIAINHNVREQNHKDNAVLPGNRL